MEIRQRNSWTYSFRCWSGISSGILLTEDNFNESTCYGMQFTAMCVHHRRNVSSCACETLPITFLRSLFSIPRLSYIYFQLFIGGFGKKLPHLLSVRNRQDVSLSFPFFKTISEKKCNIDISRFNTSASYNLKVTAEIILFLNST